jgi:hypothetical protein
VREQAWCLCRRPIIAQCHLHTTISRSLHHPLASFFMRHRVAVIVGRCCVVLSSRSVGQLSSSSSIAWLLSSGGVRQPSSLHEVVMLCLQPAVDFMLPGGCCRVAVVFTCHHAAVVFVLSLRLLSRRAVPIINKKNSFSSRVSCHWVAMKLVVHPFSDRAILRVQ